MKARVTQLDALRVGEAVVHEVPLIAPRHLNDRIVPRAVDARRRVFADNQIIGGKLYRPQRFPRAESLLLDSNGRLWVGTLYGLYVWAAGPATDTAPPLAAGHPTLLMPRDNEPHGINSERVHQFYEDAHQLLWLAASAGGVNKVDLRQRASGLLRHQLTGRLELSNANNYVNAVYRDITWN